MINTALAEMMKPCKACVYDKNCTIKESCSTSCSIYKLKEDLNANDMSRVLDYLLSLKDICDDKGLNEIETQIKMNDKTYSFYFSFNEE